MEHNNIRQSWISGALLIVFACYTYFTLEWLFFITKPSMFNFLTIDEQLAVLFISPIPLLAVCLLSVFYVFFPLGSLFLNNLRFNWLGQLFYIVVPAFITSCTLLLLIDNFTYTIFEYAVFTNTFFNRTIYATLFLCLFYISCKRLMKLISHQAWLSNHKYASLKLAAALLSSTALFSILYYEDTLSISQKEEIITSNSDSFNNVLIFSSDGINNNRTSLFGYTRDTTPYLNSIKKDLLIFENHFTNSGKTTGSIASLLSGKSPTTTRMIYRPDIFTGIHAYQHLPGILRDYGYDNGDFSVRHYADAYDLNMRNAFRFANGRDLNNEGLQLPKNMLTDIYRAHIL
ncbi:sulfatase-like hydrolase/transferase [Candidatus Pacearchaeota archaeon]|nr:sulfatase-like hydrolase/transferase [Candidatus Pacearchaeota archaeon]